MNRLQSLFGRKNNDLLSVYFTAGFPHLDSTESIIKALADAGVDMIEVGVPFSDPMADGKTIQGSSTIALRNGITLAKILDQVEQARISAPDIPLVLMSYLNPIIKFGVKNLFERCAAIGIDAMIIPDLPFREYREQYQALCREYDIPMIMLITPETSDERIRLIDEHCDGFIYMVSAAATTGTRDSFGDEQRAYFRHVDDMKLNHHRLIGFGISNPGTFADACAHASGAIIGSKFIKCLEANPDSPEAAVSELMKAIGRD
ncbi:MAG: tryptophan synthase subunit alpha [Candidatus Amulumruptor caecigallinarius]|nr:tryptophan synthase subunit alpha [Candidatus Amulumruptor caecigallinarius]MCM1397280.1 tryptophan synthase subunit alpha [Candidatus Amulumruptor caecigallinarius]MCM1453655.1 tryptophan synthase subunit alpha [bacterium]